MMPEPTVKEVGANGRACTTVDCSGEEEEREREREREAREKTTPPLSPDSPRGGAF